MTGTPAPGPPNPKGQARHGWRKTPSPLRPPRGHQGGLGTPRTAALGGWRGDERVPGSGIRVSGNGSGFRGPGSGSGWTKDRIAGSWRRWNMATPTLTLPLKGEGGQHPRGSFGSPPLKQGVRGRMIGNPETPEPRALNATRASAPWMAQDTSPLRPPRGHQGGLGTARRRPLGGGGGNDQGKNEKHGSQAPEPAATQPPPPLKEGAGRMTDNNDTPQSTMKHASPRHPRPRIRSPVR
jgi:hypothetical protein